MLISLQDSGVRSFYYSPVAPSRLSIHLLSENEFAVAFIGDICLKDVQTLLTKAAETRILLTGT